MYPAKRLPSSTKTSTPPGPNWALGQIRDGWMEKSSLNIWWMPSYNGLPERKSDFPSWSFVVDTAAIWRTSWTLSAVIRKQGCLHITLMQPILCKPLDVSIFRPLKIKWTKCVHEWKMNRARKEGEVLTKYNFAPLLKTAFDKTFEGQSVLNGFWACGLFPLIPDAVNYAKCDVARSNKTAAEAPLNAEVHGDENRRKEDCMKHLGFFLGPETLFLQRPNNTHLGRGYCGSWPLRCMEKDEKWLWEHSLTFVQ